MKSPSKVLIVLNPIAGRGRAAKRIVPLLRAFDDASITYDLVKTGSQGQAVVLAHEGRTEGYSAVVAAGGDGTINEVINGLALSLPETHPIGPLAVYPIGTGNDFAHTLRTKCNPSSIIDALKRERTQLVDLGLASLKGPSGEVHRYFHNSLGFGLEASVTQESDRIQRLSGSLLYILAAFRALRSFETPFTSIEWVDENGEQQSLEQEITVLSVGNAKRTGGAFYLTPDAEVDDGLFDVAVAGSLSRRRLLTLLPRALVGKHTNANSVTMLRCNHINAHSRLPLPSHMDGEVILPDTLEVSATVEAKRLEIFT